MQELAELRQGTRAARCIVCGKCTTMCPLGLNGGFSARMIAAQDLEDERQDGEGQVARCRTCSACEVRCPSLVRFAEFVRGLRGLVPQERRQPCSHGEVLQHAARLQSGATGPGSRPGWLGEELKTAEEGEIGLFVGCLPYFDLVFGAELGLETTGIARAAVSILNRLGIEPVLVPDERCCGHDLLWSGDREGFEEAARANAEAFARRGVKKVLTTCAECCRTWRLDYPEAAPQYAPEVQHLAEFLAGKVEKGEAALHGNGDGPLTFHDPCRLGRHLGVFDAPRRVLAAQEGREFLEMPRSGEDAVCCGTCGFIRCDAESRRLQAERLDEAAGTGAETLVTACPKCLIHLTCAQAEDRRRLGKEPDIEIQDLTVLAATWLAAGAAGDGEKPEPAVAGREVGASK